MADTEITGDQPETGEAQHKGILKEPFAEFKNEGEGCASAINLYATSLLMIFENVTKADFESLDRMESVWYIVQQIDWRRQEFDQLIPERVISLRERAGFKTYRSLLEASNG